jgi:hypothetical protein
MHVSTQVLLAALHAVYDLGGVGGTLRYQVRGVTFLLFMMLLLVL